MNPKILLELSNRAERGKPPPSVTTTLSCVWVAQPESMKPQFWSVYTTGSLKPRAPDGLFGVHGDHNSGIYKRQGLGDLCRSSAA